MDSSALLSISPLDGRYSHLTKPLQTFFSEQALINQRVTLELKYLQFLSTKKLIRPLTKTELTLISRLTPLTSTHLKQIKQHEAACHHDLKAIEFFLRDTFAPTSLKDLTPYLHLGLTSEDINNLAHKTLLQSAHNQVTLPKLNNLLKHLNTLIADHASLPMLARTHGQPAVPTTLGKEFAVFATRILDELEPLEHFTLTGKLSGAVGNYQALHFAFPGSNWTKLATEFIHTLGLKPALITTQSLPPENLIVLLQTYSRINAILIDLAQDIWRYLSDTYLIQTGKSSHVGSSTMPQKTNPIEFENAEGNLLLANSLSELFARKLPLSRLQRDLSDSTVIRNLGVFFGHSLVGYSSLVTGLSTLKPNLPVLKSTLHHNYAILGEALQTQLRLDHSQQSYLEISRQLHHHLDHQTWQQLTSSISTKLSELTPDHYLGLAPNLCKLTSRRIIRYLNKETHEPHR